LVSGISPVIPSSSSSHPSFTFSPPPPRPPLGRSHWPAVLVFVPSPYPVCNFQRVSIRSFFLLCYPWAQFVFGSSPVSHSPALLLCPLCGVGLNPHRQRKVLFDFLHLSVNLLPCFIYISLSSLPLAPGSRQHFTTVSSPSSVPPTPPTLPRPPRRTFAPVPCCPKKYVCGPCRCPPMLSEQWDRVPSV
jgi:hypothetical protein